MVCIFNWFDIYFIGWDLLNLKLYKSKEKAYEKGSEIKVPISRNKDLCIRTSDNICDFSLSAKRIHLIWSTSLYWNINYSGVSLSTIAHTEPTIWCYTYICRIVSQNVYS